MAGNGLLDLPAFTDGALTETLPAAAPSTEAPWQRPSQSPGNEPQGVRRLFELPAAENGRSRPDSRRATAGRRRKHRR